MRYSVCAHKTKKKIETPSNHLFSFDFGDDAVAVETSEKPFNEGEDVCLEVWGEEEASFVLTLLKEDASNKDVARFYVDPFTSHSIYQKPSLKHGIKVRVGESEEKILTLPRQSIELAKSLAHGIHVKAFYLIDGRPMARIREGFLLSRVDNHYHRKAEFIDYFKDKSVFLGEFKASSSGVGDAFKHLG
ncbi:MAG: hypothetical protein GF334_09345 [Candidatus Altiarchaeales archaeon]|nr:hypothetical protein [Candidatus Altiarchaeales archaeon]